MQTTLSCLIQNRLGSLDRVLGALTFRGMIPESMAAALDEASGHMLVTFTITVDSDHALEKLIKILNKQVTVIEARVVDAQSREDAQISLIKPVSFVPHSQSAHQRRVLNA